MKKIIFEDLPLSDVFDLLIESRGVIDGIEPMVESLANGINSAIGNDELYVGRNDEEMVSLYRTLISLKSSEIDTLFMVNPIFTINIYVMDNKFGDTERNLGPCYYESPLYPQVANVDGVFKLSQPKFMLSYIVPKGEMIKKNVVADKLSHELVHAKKNLTEFINVSKSRNGVRNRDSKMLSLMSSDDEKQLERLVGRILYLCSKDEINARVNQLYYQLKEKGGINRKNINNAVKLCQAYSFSDEMERYSEMVRNVASEASVSMIDKASEILSDVYGVNKFGGSPFDFLIILLSNRKNLFLRNINKVKERVLYENLTMTLRIP